MVVQLYNNRIKAFVRGKRRAPFGVSAAAFFCAVWAVEYRSASAATIRDDVPDSQYTALSAQSQYAASGYVTVSLGNGGFALGAGTLIAPDWILTAASAVTQPSNGQAYSTSLINFGHGATASFVAAPTSIASVVVASGWMFNLNAGNDMALLQLTTPITNVTPARLYSASLGSELGQQLTAVGYGFTGTGLTGYSTATGGTRRAIQNMIDAFGNTTTTGGTGIQYSFAGLSSNLMLSDFDRPGVPFSSLMGGSAPISLEGSSTAGDSGGGVFFTVNSQTYLAGVYSLTGAFNNNALSTAPDGYYGDYNGYTRVTTAASFFSTNLAIPSTWKPTTSGTWDARASWNNGDIPEFAGATANFAAGPTVATNVTLDGNWTVGNITFNNTHSYTIAPGTVSQGVGGTLTLDDGTSAAAIMDSGGTHFITAPVMLNSNTMITAANVADSMQISGNISGAGGITVSGNGSVTLSGSNSYAGTTTINSPSTLIVAGINALPAGAAVSNNGSLSVLAGTVASPVITGPITGVGNLTIGAATSGFGALRLAFAPGVPQGPTSTVTSLTINTGSQLNISNNVLLIKYSSANNDPVTTIRADLAAAYTAKYSGASLPITSSTAAASPGLFAIGYSDNTSTHQLKIAFTVPGDCDLSGTTDFNDLTTVAQFFGQSTAKGNTVSWSTGDVNYDNVVDFNDLTLVAQYFGSSLTKSQASELPASFVAQYELALAEVRQTDSVPEPMTIGLMSIAGAVLLGQRRERRCGRGVTG